MSSVVTHTNLATFTSFTSINTPRKLSICTHGFEIPTWALQNYYLWYFQFRHKNWKILSKDIWHYIRWKYLLTSICSIDWFIFSLYLYVMIKYMHLHLKCLITQNSMFFFCILSMLGTNLWSQSSITLITIPYTTRHIGF